MHSLKKKKNRCHHEIKFKTIGQVSLKLEHHSVSYNEVGLSLLFFIVFALYLLDAQQATNKKWYHFFFIWLLNNKN